MVIIHHYIIQLYNLPVGQYPGLVGRAFGDYWRVKLLLSPPRPDEFLSGAVGVKLKEDGLQTRESFLLSGYRTLLERLTSAPSFAGKDENASLDVLEIGPGKCEVALREWARGLRVGVVDFQPAEYLKEIIVSSAKKMFPGLHGPEVFILTQDRFENQRLIKQHCFWGKRYFYVLGEIRAEEGVPLCPRVARAVGNIYTLHHIPDDKQAAFLAECARLARPLSNNERSCLVVDGRNSVDSLRTILSVLALTGLFGTGGDAIISHARALEPEAILAKTKGNVCKWFAGLLGPDISLPNGRVIIKPLQIWATACHPRRIGLRV